MFSFFSVLKPTAAPEQPLISPDEGETQGDLWDPPNFIRVVTGVHGGGGVLSFRAVSAHVLPLNHTHTACILPKPSPEQSHMLISISWLVLNLTSTQGHARLLTVERHHRLRPQTSLVTITGYPRDGTVY